LFEIIWCKFPFDNAVSPNNEFHPSLVGGILWIRKLKWWGLDVIYGSSKQLDRRGGVDFMIQDINIVKDLGLSRPTRFDLGRRLVFPWSDDFFGEEMPLGRLDHDYQSLFVKCLRDFRVRYEVGDLRYQRPPRQDKDRSLN
jgi:hypothetical protein